jgi:hypothetical protein
MRVSVKKNLRNWLIAVPLLVGAGSLAYAQIEGPKRGIPPIASTGDFEVTGIQVNTTGKNAEEARRAGWEEAQRKAWSQLWARTRGGAGAQLADGTLDGIVSAIIVEEEQIGPRRYVARLGVSFDRARAGQLLGVKGIGRKSAPMLVIPMMVTGGAQVVFERQTPWQNAWAKFRTADSRIDYVRPYGGGSESLLLNAGQMDRRSRTWWRVIFDQFGAADVLYPIVRLERQWPGGPVVGKFSARYGPENRYLGSFTLRADDAKGIPAMMNEGVVKMDQLFQQAFLSGRLRAEAALLLEDIDAEDLEELEELEEEAEAATDATPADPLDRIINTLPGDTPPAKNGPEQPTPPTPTPSQNVTISVSVRTPNNEAYERAESSIRGIPGVRSVVTTSLALGGTSVMRVTYQGDPAALQSALAARGIR